MLVFLPTTWGGSGVTGGLVGCGRRVFLGAGVVVVVVVVVAVIAALVVVVDGATVVVVVVFALLSGFFVVRSPLATLIAKCSMLHVVYKMMIIIILRVIATRQVTRATRHVQAYPQIK